MRKLCLLLLLAALVAPAPVTAAVTPRRAPDACKLVGDQDVLHLLGWTVSSRERKPYSILGAIGTMCFIGSSQGQVIVIVPDNGADFPGSTPYNDPQAATVARHVYGLGGDVVLYNSTAYITRYKRAVAVHVVPNQNAASYDDVEPFAKVAISHMH